MLPTTNLICKLNVFNDRPQFIVYKEGNDVIYTNGLFTIRVEPSCRYTEDVLDPFITKILSIEKPIIGTLRLSSLPSLSLFGINQDLVDSNYSDITGYTVSPSSEEAKKSLLEYYTKHIVGNADSLHALVDRLSFETMHYQSITVSTELRSYIRIKSIGFKLNKKMYHFLLTITPDDGRLAAVVDNTFFQNMKQTKTLSSSEFDSLF